MQPETVAVLFDVLLTAVAFGSIGSFGDLLRRPPLERVGDHQADQAPPIGVVTLPVPPQSGQSCPSTLPVPSHFRQMFSPEPAVPGGTSSGVSSWAMLSSLS